MNDGVLIRNYTGRTQADAAVAFAADATSLLDRGYSPVAQSWSEGRQSAKNAMRHGLLGAHFFKPDGMLTVTYTRQHRSPEAETANVLSSDKVCPECAETVRGEASICRFCRHPFQVDEAVERPPLAPPALAAVFIAPIIKSDQQGPVSGSTALHPSRRLPGPRSPSMRVLAVVALCVALISGAYVVMSGGTPEAREAAFVQDVANQQAAARSLWLSNGDVNAWAAYEASVLGFHQYGWDGRLTYGDADFIAKYQGLYGCLTTPANNPSNSRTTIYFAVRDCSLASTPMPLASPTPVVTAAPTVNVDGERFTTFITLVQTATARLSSPSLLVGSARESLAALGASFEKNLADLRDHPPASCYAEFYREFEALNQRGADATAKFQAMTPTEVKTNGGKDIMAVDAEWSAWAPSLAKNDCGVTVNVTIN